MNGKGPIVARERLPLLGSEDQLIDVAEWLQDLGLERYVPAFRDNEIDWEVLPKLTSEAHPLHSAKPRRPSRQRVGTVIKLLRNFVSRYTHAQDWLLARTQRTGSVFGDVRQGG